MQSAAGSGRARATGRVLAGRYALLDQVGRGAMGIVWRGRDQLLDRDVAVKQIVGAGQQRTIREARNAAKLSHPGVATVFDVVEDGGTGWIVMELIRARPLDQVIAEDGPLPPTQAAQVGLALLDALAAAHAAGVLHRDVKPSNVLIRPDGTAILTDFGIATADGDPSITQEGMVVGTPGFCAPERVKGAAATPASDLWSLGATLHAAVEGRGPFDRAGGSAAIMASVATEPAPRAPSAGPLGPVIEALLDADPARRPDAGATERMLTSAWYATRGVDPSAALRGKASGVVAEVDRTTATQVVSVADPVPPSSSQAIPAAAPPADSAGPPAVGARPAAVAMPAAGDVVPDLLATPIFAELAMPDSAGSATAGKPDPASAVPGAPPGGPRIRPPRAAGPLWSRRGAVLPAALAAAAAVTAIVYLAFPSLPSTLGLALPGASSAVPPSQLAAGGGAHHRATGKHGSSGQQGAANPSDQPAPPGSTGPAGKPGRQSTPSPSGSPDPSGSPSPSGTPSPSPSPTLSQSSPPPPPAGFVWQSVTASSVGTTAGFELAAPSTWLMTPGVLTRFQPPVGVARLRVNMAPFALSGPVREAKYLQAVAIAQHLYPRYHLLSILAVTFHGRPAATWSFWWRPRLGATAIDQVDVIYTALTSAGPQPYILSISAPATRASWAGHIFRVAMRTFRPLPG